MLVRAAAHVVDLDVHQPRRGAAHAVGHGLCLVAPAVPDVEGQPEPRRITQQPGKPFVPCEILDQHARLRLETEAHVVLFRRFEDVGTTGSQMTPSVHFGQISRLDPAPERDRFGVEIRGDPHCLLQEVHALRTIRI